MTQREIDFGSVHVDGIARLASLGVLERNAQVI